MKEISLGQNKRYKKRRRNFSLVTRYSLKFARCSLLVIKSLVTSCKIRSLLVVEVACYKKSLVTRCKTRSLLVAEVESIFVTLWKKNSTTDAFLCFLRNFKNTHSVEHLRTATSENNIKTLWFDLSVAELFD